MSFFTFLSITGLLTFLHCCSTAPLAQSQIKPPYLANPDIPINQGFAPPPLPIKSNLDQAHAKIKLDFDASNTRSQSDLTVTNHQVKDWQPPKITKGEDADPETRHRRETVREMMQHAWSNYVKYAWGENELRPLSKRGMSAGIFGSTRMGKRFKLN